MKRLNVCYNNIMRRLVGVPPWESARTMFVALGVRSFGEVRRNLAYSLMIRVGKTENYCIRVLHASDAYTVSNIYILYRNWSFLLYTITWWSSYIYFINRKFVGLIYMFIYCLRDIWPCCWNKDLLILLYTHKNKRVDITGDVNRNYSEIILSLDNLPEIN